MTAHEQLVDALVALGREAKAQCVHAEGDVYGRCVGVDRDLVRRAITALQALSADDIPDFLVGAQFLVDGALLSQGFDLTAERMAVDMRRGSDDD